MIDDNHCLYPNEKVGHILAISLIQMHMLAERYSITDTNIWRKICVGCDICAHMTCSSATFEDIMVIFDCIGGLLIRVKAV